MRQRALRLRARDDRGAVAIVAAAALLLFFGLLAFTVDMGHLRVKRAHAQGVADNAALAAAFALCSGKTEAQAKAAGEAVAIANGTTAKVRKVAAGWEAVVDAQLEGEFSPVVSVNTLFTGALSVAAGTCSTNTSLPALFAGGDCGLTTFDWSGAHSVVNGDIHSNDGMKFGGDNTVNGQGTYISDTHQPSKVVWTPSADNPKKEAVKRTMPVAYSMTDYLPTSHGGTRSLTEPNYYFSTGDLETGKDILAANTTGKTLAPGTYVTTKNIKIADQGLSGNVTLVAAGTIEISSSDNVFTAYEDGLVFFSNHTDVCNKHGLKMSGQGHKLTGVIYSPNAGVEWSGSDHVIDGSIIAKEIKFNGSDHVINYGSTTTSTDPTYVLVE